MIVVLNRLESYRDRERIYKVRGEYVSAEEVADVAIVAGPVVTDWWSVPLPPCPDCGGGLLWAEAGYVPGTRECEGCGSLFAVNTKEESMSETHEEEAERLAVEADDFEANRVLPDPECAFCHGQMHEAFAGIPLCARHLKNAKRRNRIADVRGGNLEPFYIAVTGISRVYGGPEEGGWWYDVTEIKAVKKAWTWSDGLQLARELREAYPKPRFNRFSAAGGEDRFVDCYRRIEDLPEEGPFGKQRYE